MSVNITFYPLGNADTALIQLANSKLILVDYANMATDEEDDKRCDLPKELNKALKKSGQKDFSVVCITHTDEDHVKGFCDYFELKSLKSTQGQNRPKINTLWVPAAAITEKNLKGDAETVRKEARQRLKEGKGIVVFSRPDALKDFLEENNLTVEDRKNCIVDAGQLVPGFKKSADESVEFFVHCPFAWRTDERGLEDRNQDSIVFQAVFKEGQSETYALFGSDVDSETLDKIVETTKRKKNSERLQWDILKLFHHCSYKSLDANEEEREKKDKMTPIPNVKWLIEEQGRTGAIIISPSMPIPKKGTKADKDKYPPHRQAAAYYKDVIEEKDGEFEVTMEHPKVTAPKPIDVQISKFGALVKVITPSAIGTATSSESRGG